ncbi:calcium-binding protein [Leisingera caerulea]|uniref:calcium-binding protein n=1 Tax=Leisingera caerulea TaxID=506591 RepID=UPI00041B9240|nr:calcium-binding protein [Leisingera caerulea]
MELLILLGIGLTIGGVALAMDDDDDGGASEPDTSEPPQTVEPGSTTTGSDAADDLIGTGQDETAYARGGNDILEGRGGDDRLFGMDGADILVGGTGDDFMRGGAGDDYLIDNEGSDTLHGDTGDDRIITTSGIDGEGIVGLSRGLADGSVTVLSGLAEFINPDTDLDGDADSVSAGYGDDTVIAGDGDTVSLGEGSDTLVVGDWIASDDDPVIVTDFDPADDLLIYSYDGDGLPPRLSVQTVGDGTGDEGQGSALLFADDVFVARIHGAGGLLTVSDVSIVDRSEDGSLFS